MVLTASIGKDDIKPAFFDEPSDFLRVRLHLLHGQGRPQKMLQNALKVVRPINLQIEGDLLLGARKGEPIGLYHRRSKRDYFMPKAQQTANMVVKRPLCPSGWEVVPDGNFHHNNDTCANIFTMRIGIDFRGAQCGSGSGQRGIGRYIIELVSGLLQYAPEHQVSLFVANPHDPVLKSFGGTRVVHVDAPSWSDPRKPLWMKIPKLRSSVELHRRHLRKTIRKQSLAMEQALATHPVDLLHVPSGLDIGSYPIFQTAVRTTYTILDTIVTSLPELFYSKMPIYLREYYDEQARWLADKHLVAISQSTKDQAIKEFGFKASAIDVVYPSIDPSFGIPREASNRASQPYYLFCSVPDPHKNPLNVIRAFARSGVDGQLVFISPNDGQYTDELRRVAQDEGIADRFLLTGFVDQSELIALFQHAKALISPSSMEGFGYPVAQALLAGLPVVTSNCYAQAEIAEGVGWLIDPHSVDEIAKAIRMVDGSRVEAGKLRAQQFSPENTTKQLLEHYAKVLGSHPY